MPSFQLKFWNLAQYREYFGMRNVSTGNPNKKSVRRFFFFAGKRYELQKSVGKTNWKNRGENRTLGKEEENIQKKNCIISNIEVPRYLI